MNTLDLVTAEVAVKIACYADGDDGSNGTDIRGITVNSFYDITIYTPTDIANECNNNQRHDGTVDGGGYTLRASSNANTIQTVQTHLTIDGLKIVKEGGTTRLGILISNYSQYCEVKNNLIIGNGSSTTNGLLYCLATKGSDGANSFHDNIVIGLNSSYPVKWGIRLYQTATDSSANQSFIYNNTVYGYFSTCAIEYNSAGGAAGTAPDTTYACLMKNNVASNLGTGTDYAFATNSSNAGDYFDYNASDDGTAGTTNDNQTILIADCEFVDTTLSTLDLHIKTNSDLVGQGIGPDSDTNVPSLDINGNTRSGTTCDMGADEEAPIGHWKLDSKSGTTAIDSSGNGNNGTLTNMAGTEWSQGIVPGATDGYGAVTLDGSDDRIMLGGDNTYKHLTEGTISFWMKISDIDNTAMPFSVGPNVITYPSTSVFYFYLPADGTMEVYTRVNGSTVLNFNLSSLFKTSGI